MNLTVKSHRVELNGNLMTGDTYPIKQWIKTYLCGKWDGERKGWIVDLGQVQTWTGTCIQVSESAAPVVTASRTSTYHTTLCPRCHTYCDGDCTAN